MKSKRQSHEQTNRTISLIQIKWTNNFLFVSHFECNGRWYQFSMFNHYRIFQHIHNALHYVMRFSFTSIFLSILVRFLFDSIVKRLYIFILSLFRHAYFCLMLESVRFDSLTFENYTVWILQYTVHRSDCVLGQPHILYVTQWAFNVFLPFAWGPLNFIKIYLKIHFVICHHILYCTLT